MRPLLRQLLEPNLKAPVHFSEIPCRVKNRWPEIWEVCWEHEEEEAAEWAEHDEELHDESRQPQEAKLDRRRNLSECFLETKILKGWKDASNSLPFGLCVFPRELENKIKCRSEYWQNRETQSFHINFQFWFDVSYS